MKEDRENYGVSHHDMKDVIIDDEFIIKENIIPKRKTRRNKYKRIKDLNNNNPDFIVRYCKDNNLSVKKVIKAEVLTKDIEFDEDTNLKELFYLFEEFCVEPFSTNSNSLDNELIKTEFWKILHNNIPRVQNWEIESKIRFLYKLYSNVRSGIEWRSQNECVTLLSRGTTLEIIDGNNRLSFHRLLNNDKFIATIYKV